MKRNLGRLITLWLIGLFVLVAATGCDSSSSPGTSINMGQMAREADQKQKAIIQNVRETQKDVLDKMYGKGLIDQDFSDVKQRLDKEYSTRIEREINALVSVPYFVKCDTTYFNSTLRDAKAGNWNIDKVLENTEGNIRESHISVYLFEDPTLIGQSSANIELFNYNKKLINYAADYEKKFNYKKIHFIECCCDQKALMKKTVRTYANSKEYEFGLAEYVLSKGSLTGIGKDLFVPARQFLEAKYGEKFLFIGESEKQIGKGIYAPVNHLDLKFEMDSYYFTELDEKDKYLSVLAQKYLSEEMDRIIKAQGLDGKMAFLIVPHSIKDDDTDMNGCQTAHIKTRSDQLKFLNEVYGGNYDVNLMYLKEADEAVDHAKIKKSIEQVQSLITHPGKGELDEADTRVSCFVSFYNMGDEDRRIALKLLKRDRITENYYREQVQFSNLLSNMFIRREETDGFHYLDVYGQKENKEWSIMGKLKPMTTDEFVEDVTQKTNPSLDYTVEGD